jgi:aryl sulfotransferase
MFIGRSLNKEGKMVIARPELPPTNRIFSNAQMDSTIWEKISFRDGDIIVASYAKTGTTWTQQIVAQLIFNGDPAVGLKFAPWIDLRIDDVAGKLAMVEAQTHRRLLKTHLPFDALRFSPTAKYIYVARDGRDVGWSLHNHFINLSDARYKLLNASPGRTGRRLERPGLDVRAFFLEWLEQDGYPLWPFWHHIRCWWAARTLPNVRLIHFNELKRDMPAAIRSIAAFLDIEIDDARWNAIVEHCSFDFMKDNGRDLIPGAENVWSGGARTFFNKGTNGRWRDRLTDDDNRLYTEIALRELGQECARWLETGKG